MRGKADTSVVSDRLANLKGRRLKFKLKEYSLEPGEPQEFFAVYLDVIPVGRTYFFVVSERPGVQRMVSTEQVLEIIIDKSFDEAPNPLKP